MSKIFLIFSLFSLGASSKVFSVKSFKKIEASRSVSKLTQEKKHLMIFYWATWCVNCKKKLKSDIPKFRKKFPHISFIAVNIDEDKRRVKKFIKKYELKEIPHYSNEKLTKKLNITQAPFWTLFKVKGKKIKLVKKKLGFQRKELEKMFKKLKT